MSSKKAAAAGTKVVTSTIVRNAPRKKKGKKKGPKFLAIQPFTMYRQHKYTDSGTLDVSAGPATYAFCCNGLYDPNITGTGHQPMGFDQMKVFYNHYVVHSSYIKATFWTEDSSTQYGAVVGIKLADDTTIGTSCAAIIEQRKPMLKWRFLRTSSANSPSVTRVTQKFIAKKYFGRKDIADNGQDLGAAVGANPTEQAEFVLFAAHDSDATDLPAIRFIVEIVYNVQYDEPTDLATS